MGFWGKFGKGLGKVGKGLAYVALGRFFTTKAGAEKAGGALKLVGKIVPILFKAEPFIKMATPQWPFDDWLFELLHAKYPSTFVEKEGSVGTEDERRLKAMLIAEELLKLNDETKGLDTTQLRMAIHAALIEKKEVAGGV